MSGAPNSPLAAAFELEFAHKVNAEWVRCRRVAVMHLVDEWRRLRDTYEPDAPLLPTPAGLSPEKCVQPAMTAFQEHLASRRAVVDQEVEDLL